MPKSQNVKKDVTDTFLWVFRAGVGFILLSALLFLIGFATDHWLKDGDNNCGLWEICQHGKCKNFDQDSLPDYHIATQALQIVAAIFYTLSPVLHFFLYCGKKKKSTDFRTRIFDVGFSIGTVFHLVSVVVFGLQHKLPGYLSWSYNMSAAAVGLGVVGVFLITISRKKALHVFHFLPGSRHKPRDTRVGTLASSSSGSSRPGTPQSGVSARSRNVFEPQIRRSIKSQSSISSEVSTPLSQPESSFVTATSSVPYPDRLTSPDGKYSFGTPMTFNAPRKNTGSTGLLLHAMIKPSTSGQLAPLRAPPQMIISSAPPLRTTPV